MAKTNFPANPEKAILEWLNRLIDTKDGCSRPDWVAGATLVDDGDDAELVILIDTPNGIQEEMIISSEDIMVAARDDDDWDDDDDDDWEDLDEDDDEDLDDDEE